MGKSFDVLWLFGELDEPLMAALPVFVHEDGCCCVFQYLSTGLGTCFCKSLFGIVDYEFFAEGIDEELRAPRNNELVGILLAKLISQSEVSITQRLH